MNGSVSVANVAYWVLTVRPCNNYRPISESEENLALMRLLDEQYTRTPCYGVLKMMVYLRTQGYQVNAKQVRRLLRIMGLEAVYQKPNTSQPNPQNTRFTLICCVG